VPDATLNVTSHVGRDLLQSAQLFRHEHSVVWEYVSNGLQYKDPTTKPTAVVKVDLKAKTMSIRDNGRGMLMKDLQRYFQMHGENLDRKEGRPGRGYFGTGKSAAFGIANTLRITTIRDGKLSKVELQRADIETRRNGEEIPVKVLAREAPSRDKNGTLVEIEDIFLKQIDIPSMIRHIERHIAHWPDATVIVNHHECQFVEPDFQKEYQFLSRGTEYEKLIGSTTLFIKVAKAPLDEELRGIAVLADGVWHESTLAGCDRKPFAEYLFGKIDVPALSKQSDIPAFDMSRSMKLNPRNEVVGEMLRFIGVNLESVRRELEKQDRERRQTEEQKKLREQGSKIAELINQHFNQWRSKLRSTMAKAGTGKDLLSAKERQQADEAALVPGDEIPGFVLQGIGERDGPNPSLDPGPKPGPVPQIVKADPAADTKVAKPSSGRPKPAAAGGFNVEFEKMGINEKRAKYDRDTRTIYINLEHPRIAVEVSHTKARSPVDDPTFMRMAYEIAFTEYAIVLAQELSSAQYYFDPQDALVEVRQTLDDLSKAFASVWQSPGAKH
jgi:hypothetical protein